MPELPDVENYGRYLRRHGLDKRIERVEIGSAKIFDGISKRKLARALEVRRLTEAHRHGKHLFAELDEGGSLALHFGMTGRLAAFASAEGDPEHDRLRLDFADGTHLAFVNQRLFGRVRLVADVDGFPVGLSRQNGSRADR